MERLKNRPFALIGMNTDDPETFRTRAKRENVSWRNSLQGRGGGPIVREWGVRSFPTIYVIDGKGRIRHMNLRDQALENAVLRLLDELEAETKPAPVQEPKPAGKG